jgi:hypothetical protein
MKTSARLLALALIVVPAVPALAATTAPATPTAVPAAGTVARYTFDAGATAAGRIAENSGRGLPLTVRAADRGAVRFVAAKTGRYVAFPAACAKGARTCPRALLEAPNDADLNPGVRTFTWGATIAVSKSMVVGSSNVMQKGVSTTDSQWKLQLGATRGPAQCVVVGRGTTRAYIVRSSVPVADGAWHRVACQRAGAALTVFVDGVNRGRVAIPATLSITNTLPLRIGGPNFTTTSDMFHGYLDDAYAVLG